VGDPPQVLNRDEARPLSVEQAEDVVDVVDRVVFDQSRRQQVDELLEGDIASALSVQLQDHLVDRLVAGLGAKGGQGAFEFWVVG
jgi:hypothetical protein